MARTNRTRFAVLGMLMEAPRSGYDLKQVFEEQIGHFWSESIGQIYPALKQLHDDKWVTMSVHRQPGRPERKVYRPTKLGEQAFCAWLKEPAAPVQWRNELLLKIYFGGAMETEDVLAHLERFESAQRALLELYKRFAVEIETREASPTRRLYWRLTLASGQHINRARLAWCRQAKQEIEAFIAEERDG